MDHAILLAGGSGTRLKPFSNYLNKALFPLHDRFVIDYPINTLVQMGIKHLTVVLGGDNFADVVSYLKDGEEFGVEINFVYQKHCDGIAQAINLAKSYVEHEDSFVVILGDNVFSDPIRWENTSTFNPHFAQIALCQADELHRFGVASLSKDLRKIMAGRQIVKIEEKPKVIDETYDNFAISGCYRFNRDFFSMFKKLKKSVRGEFEITDIIQQYLDKKELHHTFVEGIWQDAGTFESIAKIRKLIEIGRIKI